MVSELLSQTLREKALAEVEPGNFKGKCFDIAGGHSLSPAEMGGANGSAGRGRRPGWEGCGLHQGQAEGPGVDIPGQMSYLCALLAKCPWSESLTLSQPQFSIYKMGVCLHVFIYSKAILFPSASHIMCPAHQRIRTLPSERVQNLTTSHCSPTAQGSVTLRRVTPAAPYWSLCLQGSSEHPE